MSANGLQLIDNCREIAQRQFPSEPTGAAQCEIELLRTKVLELSKKLSAAEREAAQVEKLKLDLWVVGSRFNCLAIDRPQLPAEAAFSSTSEYLKACAEIIDAHMQAAVAWAAQALKARKA